MLTLAKVSRRLNSPRTQQSRAPHLILMTDDARLTDPGAAMARLGPGCAVIVRSRDRKHAVRLAGQLKGLAKRRGIKILLAGDVRDALRLGLDGVHLSEHAARRGAPKIKAPRPGFLISAAAHDRRALWRAKKAGAHFALLSTVFATESHPERRPLGVLRFQILCRGAGLQVIALGGIDDGNVRRLLASNAAGIAAIGALV